MAISILFAMVRQLGRSRSAAAAVTRAFRLGYSVTEEEIRCGYLQRGASGAVSGEDLHRLLSKLTPTLYELEKIAFIIDLKRS